MREIVTSFLKIGADGIRRSRDPGRDAGRVPGAPAVDHQAAVRRRPRVRQHAAGRDGDAARHLPRASARRLVGRPARGPRLLRSGVCDHAGAHASVRRARRQPVAARRPVWPRPDRARGVRRRGVSARRHGVAVSTHVLIALSAAAAALFAPVATVWIFSSPAASACSSSTVARSASRGARAWRSRWSPGGRRVVAGDSGRRCPGRHQAWPTSWCSSVSSAPSRSAALSPSSGSPGPVRPPARLADAAGVHRRARAWPADSGAAGDARAYVGYKVLGLTGAVVAAIAIFSPSFVMMFALLPVFERVRTLTWATAALQGMVAGVIGMLASHTGPARATRTRRSIFGRDLHRRRGGHAACGAPRRSRWWPVAPSSASCGDDSSPPGECKRS